MSITLILTILSAVSGLFSKFVGSNWESVIQNGLSALGALIVGWTSKSPSADVTASLTALQSILKALQSETGLAPSVLAQVEEAIVLVEAGIAAYQQAESGALDPSTLPVPPAVQ